MEIKRYKPHTALHTFLYPNNGNRRLSALPFKNSFWGERSEKYNSFRMSWKLIIITILIFILAYSMTVNGNSKEHTTYYTSVEVAEGDSLWSIAEKYNNLGISTTDYVEKLQKMNKTSGMYIHPGDYILIAYYK